MVSLLLYDSNERFLLLSNKLSLPSQVGVHARACQRYTGGQDAGCVTKPQGVGVTCSQVYMSVWTEVLAQISSI